MFFLVSGGKWLLVQNSLFVCVRTRAPYYNCLLGTKWVKYVFYFTDCFKNIWHKVLSPSSAIIWVEGHLHSSFAKWKPIRNWWCCTVVKWLITLSCYWNCDTWTHSFSICIITVVNIILAFQGHYFMYLQHRALCSIQYFSASLAAYTGIRHRTFVPFFSLHEFQLI